MSNDMFRLARLWQAACGYTCGYYHSYQDATHAATIPRYGTDGTFWEKKSWTKQGNVTTRSFSQVLWIQYKPVP